MLRRYAAIVFAAMLALTSPPLRGQDKAPSEDAKCSVHGRIVDPMGAVIYRAFVLVYSDAWEKIDQQVALNKDGQFDIRLKPGLYDLFIASPGFIPFAKVVDSRSCKPVTLKVKLMVDAEHLDD